MAKFLYADPLRCTGCRICELVCSFTKEKVLSHSHSRIKVVREYEIDKPISCRNCEKPKCLEVCPKKAIRKDIEKAQNIIIEEKCNGCGKCLEACPFGAIVFLSKKNIVAKCDL
ncbi:MAG: 4Fe-4S dicluster domain-containing protein, partial [Candidatus Thermoplasmatota archaeon]